MNLAEALRALWSDREGEAVSEIREALAAIFPACPASIAPADAPTKLLEHVATTASLDTAGICAALLAARDRLPWYPNSVYEEEWRAAAEQNYCANLVGRVGGAQANPFLFDSDEILLGLFLLGPSRHYPAHRHPARETWLTLAGTGIWRRGGEDWRPRPPGSLFTHAPDESHAMRSHDEPVLAMWAWTGDLSVWARWAEE